MCPDNCLNQTNISDVSATGWGIPTTGCKAPPHVAAEAIV
jgi:hypothetical protein